MLGLINSQKGFRGKNVRPLFLTHSFASQYVFLFFFYCFIILKIIFMQENVMLQSKHTIDVSH